MPDKVSNAAAAQNRAARQPRPGRGRKMTFSFDDAASATCLHLQKWCKDMIAKKFADQDASTQLRACGLDLSEDEADILNPVFRTYTDRESEVEAAQKAAEAAYYQPVRGRLLRFAGILGHDPITTLPLNKFYNVFKIVYPLLYIIVGLREFGSGKVIPYCFCFMM